ncbi:putative SAM-dependent methyltransferase [Flavobacterium sp. CG_9.1]|uniref:class I SAM-dependent methyltransferase n=1 Tax=Flavobacterium sp. CG_9.1 TaxID=2787728 RepID=UPI0018C8F841|nr:methyltransferase domain-containing protein [Flavobacterium sp. CG_9.1]MBG6062960.1 putative SAM-dependent methyltransferase [Flavobacterium sp. CG_9.1]
MKKILKKVLSLSPFGVYEVYRDRKARAISIKEQKTIIDAYIETNQIKKMQIGSGSNVLEGWLNTDLNYSESIAFLDAGITFPIISDSFDFIYSEHLFEHLKVEQQVNMLREGHRILKKGGVMRIATPNLDFLFKIYSDPHSRENLDYVDYYINASPYLKSVKILGIKKDQHHIYVINNFFKAWGHQVIHDFSSIKKLAMQCSYTSIRQCKVGESEVPFLQNIEKHGTIIPERINLIETMVVEIIK